MPVYATQRRVPFTADQMFAVVADVERYPEFLPLCEGLEVVSRTETGEGAVLVAVMDVGYRAIRQSFTSRVTLAHTGHEIRVRNLNGPFRRLENRWRFSPHPDGCTIDFFIDYEFSSRLLALSMGAVFDHAVRRYTEAFESRARTLYRAASADPAIPTG